MERKKKLIVLPGSAMQVPLVRKLKEKGYYIISFHPSHDFPTKQYSDEYRVVDILDKERCLEFAREINPNVILSEECDIAMPTIAYLSKELALPSLSIDDASLFTDKSKMRDFCKENEINSPDYCKCYKKTDAVQFYKKMNCKCILKPLDSNCSKGVFIIDSELDIDKYWAETISFSKCSNAILIEQYIDGTEFTIDGVVTPAGHKSLAISEKRHYDYNPSIAYELFFSNQNDQFDYEELRRINDYFVDSSTLPVGFFTHAEYKCMNGQFYLIEIGARGGGNYISSDIVPVISGVDNYEFMIDTLVERNSDNNIVCDKKRKDICAVLYFFDVPMSGRVKEICGLDVLQSNPSVLRYELRFKVGETISRAKNDSARVGYYIAYAENQKKLRDMMDKINNTFKIVVE